jgi:hypothetical protein
MKKSNSKSIEDINDDIFIWKLFGCVIIFLLIIGIISYSMILPKSTESRIVTVFTSYSDGTSGVITDICGHPMEMSNKVFMTRGNTYLSTINSYATGQKEEIVSATLITDKKQEC